MEVEILNIWKLSVGDLYTIKFPLAFQPSVGFCFVLDGCVWQITAIVSGSGSGNSVREKMSEGIWDCLLLAHPSNAPEIVVGKHFIVACSPTV
jgi:hypothetical protein